MNTKKIQTKNNKRKRSLLNSLKEFGLNPRFWTLIPLKAHNLYLVVHKQNPQLCLKGTAWQARWKNLTWQI